MAVTSMANSSIRDFGKRNTMTNTVVIFGGNETATIGGYKYFLFTESGAFTIANGIVEAEILCVGAGGGGGNDIGGGGGAGAIEGAGPGYYATQTLGVGSYSVEVGAGGLGQNSATGGSSVFSGTSTITALGGGGGGALNGKAGGSGGGARSANQTYYGGAANGNNTNVGGDASNPSTTWYYGAGGGGATAAGVNGNHNDPGEGGEGLALTTIDANLTSANFSAFTGMTVIASGGGGCNVRSNSGSMAAGAFGGTGGGRGGASGSSYGELNATTDPTSFGSGGGGGAWSFQVGSPTPGSDGYDGLVIVRYAL